MGPVSVPYAGIRILNGFHQHLVAGHANHAYERAAIEKIATGKHIDRPLR